LQGEGNELVSILHFIIYSRVPGSFPNTDIPDDRSGWRNKTFRRNSRANPIDGHKPRRRDEFFRVFGNLDAFSGTVECRSVKYNTNNEPPLMVRDDDSLIRMKE
jgi:hypothetical protein